MTIHKEGKTSIIIASLLAIIPICTLLNTFSIAALIVSILTLCILFIVIYFFRIPKRNYREIKNAILAPCDGRVVAIEEIYPDEYFSDKRILVSVFMDPLNVHVNLNPITGTVVYSKYHSGCHLVAWHPKSSNLNERHSVVYRLDDGREILARQIAGALARRIVNYLKVGTMAKQTEEMGFIKFGSRVDLMLPLEASIKVKLGDLTIGGQTIIAKWY